ncbi:hypothetical protein ACFY65_20605 [Streptomyces cellulosae]
MAPGAAVLRAVPVLPGPVLVRTRTAPLRTAPLRTGTLRTAPLRTGTLRASTPLRAGTLLLSGTPGKFGPLRRPLTPLRLSGSLVLPLPLRRALPLRLPGSPLRLARAALRVAGPAGTLMLARAVLRRPGTDGARQRLADLELGPLGHLADLGHDVTALAHESVVDREVVGGGGGGSHGVFPSWGISCSGAGFPAP